MGYPIGDPAEIEKLLSNMKFLHKLSNLLGFKITVIDIGGGFVSKSHNYKYTLQQYQTIFDKFQIEFPDAKLCSEPGRYFVEDSMDYFVKVDSVHDKI